MSRIEALDPGSANGRTGDLLAAVQKKLGATPNLVRVMANEPAVLDAYLKFSDSLAHGSFAAQTREAIALATAGANSCDYCASAHTAISKNLKVDPSEIEARLSARSADPKLQALLDFSRAVIEKRGEVADEDLNAVRRAGYGDGEIVEAIANIALNILTNYLNNVAHTEIDFPPVRVKQVESV